MGPSERGPRARAPYFRSGSNGGARKGKNAMDFVPVPDGALVEIVATLDGQVCENTLWFQSSGDFNASDLLDLGNGVLEWWGAQMAPGISDQVSITGANVTDMRTQTGPGVFVLPAAPMAGEGTSPPLPNNVALCISFRTAFRGRSARGRNYIFGLQENQSTKSHVDAGVTDFFQDAYATMIGAGTLVAGWQWSVVSRITAGNPRTSALVRPVIAAVIVDPVLDSQRRRLPGRGA